MHPLGVWTTGCQLREGSPLAARAEQLQELVTLAAILGNVLRGKLPVFGGILAVKPLVGRNRRKRRGGGKAGVAQLPGRVVMFSMPAVAVGRRRGNEGQPDGRTPQTAVRSTLGSL